MVDLLKPARGGFLRPFGCGEFIRGFLLGHGPNCASRSGYNRQTGERVAAWQRGGFDGGSAAQG